ncbi:hypothetical protein JK191_07560 [Gluconobacter sphaericus]|uniref:hypothetical protein n=1 Tax=Gluconobacter sphaericus TaxID=574987 RepID=UPI001B8ADDE2|nr:hypothetical protein [Gluconobacter sphaericus]MBS1097427.1 hypothetical protein [Gluconobacter sphaericus]
MMRRSILTLMLCSGLTFVPPQGHASPASTKPTSKITDIQPILVGNRPVTVHPTGFPPVTVTPFWRENGNAWGYTLYAVSIPETEAPYRTALVDTEDADHNGQLLDMLQDIPHTGEDALQTIHFASARMDGKPAFLLFISTRDNGTNPAPQLSPAHIRVYQLTAGDGEPGSTLFYFALRTTLRPPVTTCHADIALSAATKIPFAKWNGDQEPVPTCLQ